MAHKIRVEVLTEEQKAYNLGAQQARIDWNHGLEKWQAILLQEQRVANQPTYLQGWSLDGHRDTFRFLARKERDSKHEVYTRFH